MTAMPSAMSTRETNRLHRWAMWRMTVNEGIINCIRDNGTARVIHPDSTSDTHSVTSTENEFHEFHEFPFITAEQMSLARKMNLREKYGSSHGLSDDAYFIFGLPRITVGKDVPEVTSTGTRSVYGSFSDFGAAMELNNNNSSNSNNYYNHNNQHSPRGTVPVTVAEQTNMTLNLTYSELGPTPDVQSLTSHDDSEVQRINGFREVWRTPVSPVPRLNLYSIQEEFNNNNNNSNNYYAGETTDRYSSDRYYNGPAQSYNAGEYHTGETTDRYHSDRYHNSSVQTYNGQDVNVLHSSNWYHARDTTDRYSSDRYRTVETTDRYSSDRYHNHSGMQSFNAGDVSDQHSTSRHYTTSAAPSYNARVTADGYSAAQPFSRNDTAPWQNDSRQDIYPPFSNSRQIRHSPMRQSYSTPPTSPGQNYSPLQVSTSRRSYSPSPTSPRQSYSPTTMSPRQSYSPSSVSPRESYSPAFRQIGSPSTGPAKGVGSPGYGSKTRPTTLLSDGETERLKRQAYYDWGTPSTDRYMPDFASHSRYS